MNLAHRIFHTTNGMEVLLIKRPEKYTVGFSLLINAGSIYEDKNTSGISHFFEHLFFTGTKTYPTEKALRKRQQEIGLSAGARTDYDRIEAYGSFPKDETANCLSVLKEMVFESLLQPQMIEKERNIILEEERLRQDNNYVQLWNNVFAKRFQKNNTLQLPIEGTPETIISITKSQLMHFYKTHCTTANATLVIGCSIDFEKLEKVVRSIFEPLPKSKKIKPPVFTNKHMSNQSIGVAYKQTRQLYFLLSFPSYPGDDLYRSWKYGFVMDLLYEKLNQALRIEKGLVYELTSSSGYIPTKNTAFAYVQTSCDTENFSVVLAAVFQKINNMRKGKIDVGLFERLRNTGNKTLPMNFDTLSGVMNWCTNTFYREGKIYSPEEVIKARNRVTIEDLKRTARSLFEYKKLNVVVLGPMLEESVNEKVKKYLQKNATLTNT